MATRSGQKAPGERPRGASPTKTVQADPRAGQNARAGTAERDQKAGSRTSQGPGSFAEIATRQRPEREDGAVSTGVRRPGPRRILIFARTFKEASAIAKRKGYPRELWRFVTGPADADVDPREWATITVVGFGKDRPLAKDAYDLFQARCRGFGIRAPSYDP